MDNDVFVKKLIVGTKNQELVWKIDQKVFSSTTFYLEKGSTILVLVKYFEQEFDAWGTEIEIPYCAINICDFNRNIKHQVLEGDLTEQSELFRLYRLVERQVNNVDSIMEEFVEGIDL